MSSIVRTAIAIPKEDFKLIESIRKQTGKSRSQIFVEAFHAWLEHHRNKALETRYAEAYRKQPEDLSSLQVFDKADKSVWKKEAW